MRHNKAHRKFNRTTNQRKALLNSLAISLIEKEQIVTTLPKAKEIRSFVECLVTKGADCNTNSAFNTIYRKIHHRLATQKILADLGPRFKERPGGYLRIIKAGFRHGDNAPLAIIEFVDTQFGSVA